MKQVLVAVAVCLALANLGANAQEQKSKVGQINPTKPQFVELDGEPSSYEFHRFYERKTTLPKPALGPIDQWRYDSCRSEAAKAPSDRGVIVGINLCREKFGQ